MAAEATAQTGAYQRGYIGSAFRVALDFVEARGITAQVKTCVSMRTLELMEDPPFPFGWIAAQPMDELQTAIAGIAGRQACVELGLAAGRNLGGSMIAPVLRMATSLFGNSPAAVFRNLERFYAVVLRGMTFDYQELGERDGRITARAMGAGVPAALFDVTRGNLLFVLELCKVTGSVEAPEGVRLGAMEGEARYRVHWE